MHSLLIGLTVAATLVSAAVEENTAQEKADGRPIRVLLVTGVDYKGHHWKETTPVIRELLEEDKRFKVRVVETPDFLANDEIFNYDVIFLHFKNYKPLADEKQAQENLLKFVKQGKGLFAFHFACGAFEKWPEFANLVGKVWDQKTGHDRRGPFTVKIVDSEHPITRSMNDFQADDELYTCLIGELPVKVLATSRSKVTGKDHPMAFVFNYGKGRVFHSPLGHDVRAIRKPGVAELIRRGCAWAAGHKP